MTSLQSPLARKPIGKIILAFSGGLDTSALIPWLKETYDAEVVAYCSDLGNAPDATALEKKALELGASQLIFEDLRQTFSDQFVFPLIRAGAIYQNDYLLGTAIARPLIAERVAHFAKTLGADAVAHGATGKGNDQIRFERAWAYLIPEIEVIAPWKIWGFTGRQDLIKYLNSKGYEFKGEEKRYSVDVNLLHRSCEGGILENIQAAYSPEEVYEWIAPPGASESRQVLPLALTFEAGRAVAVNGERLNAEALLTKLNAIAEGQGIGVVDLVEERFNGVKSRGIYETPGGTLLHLGLKNIKHLVWDRSLNRLATELGVRYAELVYDGLWHSPIREGLEAFFDKSAEMLTGEVKFVLQEGRVIVTHRSSPYSLYSHDLVSFESDIHGLNRSALGFSQTVSYPCRQAGVQRQNYANARKLR